MPITKTTIDFILCDWNMFAANTSNYSKQAIELFKRCIGRVYDQSNKRWLFPNRSYNFLYNLIKNCDTLEIGQTIPDYMLSKIQIIVYKEDAKHFFIKTPFDEKIIDLFSSLNGFFVPETKLWCFESSNREKFNATVLEKEYEIKFEKDQPQSIKKFLF